MTYNNKPPYWSEWLGYFFSLEIEEEIKRRYNPGMKFISLDNVSDIVNKECKIYTNIFGDVFILGNNSYRFIYNFSTRTFAQLPSKIKI